MILANNLNTTASFRKKETAATPPPSGYVKGIDENGGWRDLTGALNMTL